MELIPFSGAIVSFLLFLSQWMETYQIRKKQRQANLYSNRISINSKYQVRRSRLIDDSATLLYFLLCLLQFHIYLEITNGFVFLKILYGIHVPILFSIGPVCYLYFQKLSGGNGQNINRFHFLPVFIVLFLVVLVRFFDFHSIPNMNEGFHNGTFFQKTIYVLLGIGVVSLILYQIYFLYILFLWNQKFKESLKHTFLPFCILVAYTFIISCLFVIAQLFYMPLFLLACFGLLILLILVFLLNANRLELIPNFEKETSYVRYQESRLKGVNLQETFVRLEQLMRLEQLFLNEGLTLAILAKHLKITSHQLSEILNFHLGVSFRNYTNRYRLEYAARLLKEKPSMAIISIVYTSGFNSKSSFHTEFQKYFKVSPQSYRNRSE